MHLAALASRGGRVRAGGPVIIVVIVIIVIIVISDGAASADTARAARIGCRGGAGAGGPSAGGYNGGDRRGRGCSSGERRGAGCVRASRSLLSIRSIVNRVRVHGGTSSPSLQAEVRETTTSQRQCLPSLDGLRTDMPIVNMITQIAREPNTMIQVLRGEL